MLGTAVVTGASSGIGAATARGLAAAGFEVVLGARRLDRLEAVAAELSGARALPLDVTDASSVESFCGQVPSCRVLVNNAGGALGLEPIAEADEEKWREMWESNVLGTLRMTRGLLGELIASGDGLVVNVCSVAAFWPYPGGAGYNAAKAAERALTDVPQDGAPRPPRAGDRDRSRHGGDRLLPCPLRGRRGPCEGGLRGRRPAQR